MSKPAADGREARGPGGARAASQGPFDAARPDQMEALGQLKGVHYVYVCTRQGPGAAVKSEPEAGRGPWREQDGGGGGGPGA